jgi:lysophospholipase L1-like esterase/plastocyanin
MQQAVTGSRCYVARARLGGEHFDTEKVGVVRMVIAHVARARRRSRTVIALTLALAMTFAVTGSAEPASAAVTESTAGPLGFFTLDTPVQVLAPTTVSWSTTQDFSVTASAHTSNVSAAALQVTVIGAGTTVNGQLRVYSPDETAVPAGGNVEYVASTDAVHQVTTRVATSGANAGKVRLRNQAWGGTVKVSVAIVGYFATKKLDFYSSWYHGAFQPSHATTVDDGTVERHKNDQWRVAIAGAAGVPANATEVAVRITTTPPSSPVSGVRKIEAYTPYPTGTASGNAYSPNGQWDVTETVAKSHVATLPLDQGAIGIRLRNMTENDGVRLFVKVDVLGWFDGPAYGTAGYHQATPVARSWPVTTASTAIDLRGVDGVPARTDCPGFGNWPDNGTECVLSVVVDATVSGLTGTSAPTALNVGGTPQLYARPGETTVNQLILPVDRSTGLLPGIALAAGSATLSVRVVGWYEHARYSYGVSSSTGSRYVGVTPTVIYSSTGYGAGANATIELTVTGVAGVPAHGVTAVALAVDIPIASGATSVTVSPKDRPAPALPQVQATSTRRDSNAVIAEVGTDGKVRAKVGAANAYFSVSIEGYYTPYQGDDADPAARSVALIGDSITEGGTSVYQAGLEPTERLNLLGRSGYTSHQMRWWVDQIGMSAPDVAIVNLGTNDAWLWGYDHSEAVLATASAPRSCTYVVTINSSPIPPADWGAAYYGRVGTINASLRAAPSAPGATVGVIDWDQYVIDNQVNGAHLQLVNPGTAAAPDGIHPTALGREHLSALYVQASARTATPYVTPCTAP